MIAREGRTRRRHAELAEAELASLRATIATQRHRERALHAHDRAVELAPKDPLPRGLRGLFHARIGEIAAARADLEAALALRPAERWRALARAARARAPRPALRGCTEIDVQPLRCLLAQRLTALQPVREQFLLTL
ncbi:MAG: tetratricopeptide repeat protein [Planctomycetes bacterium]|nr:tetratricopeptide repeat protein [Planctomycetota bacterium]